MESLYENNFHARLGKPIEVDFINRGKPQKSTLEQIFSQEAEQNKIAELDFILWMSLEQKNILEVEFTLEKDNRGRHQNR